MVFIYAGFCLFNCYELHSGILKVSSCPPVENTGKGGAKVGNPSPGYLPKQGLAPGGCFIGWVAPKVLSTNRPLKVPLWNFKYLKPRKAKELPPGNFEYSPLERNTVLADTTRVFFLLFYNLRKSGLRNSWFWPILTARKLILVPSLHLCLGNLYFLVSARYSILLIVFFQLKI